MQNKKALWRLVAVALAIGCLVPVIYFMVTLYSSKPVDVPLVKEQVEKAVAEDYANCIILYPEKTVFITEGIKDSITAGQIIPSVNNNLQSVQKSPSSIIITPETSRELIGVALDACTAAGLKDYRILALQMVSELIITQRLPYNVQVRKTPVSRFCSQALTVHVSNRLGLYPT